MVEPVAPLAVPPSARQSTLRATNLGIVLRSVCAASEPLSRAGLAALTGMTRSTVSRLVDSLVAGGLVDEGSPQLVGPGRPAVPLTPSRHRVGALGLQVNAAHVAARLVDLGGEVIAESRSEPNLVGSRPGPALALLAGHAREVLALAPPGLRLVGAGLALPGLVDGEGRRLLRAPNLGWHDLDPRTELAGLLDGTPLGMGNEASLAAHAFAQPRPGCHGPYSHFIYLSGEIGIGGAVVSDWQVQEGLHGLAGEIGHMTYRPDGPRCPCGSTGCLERYAGRLAMAHRAGVEAMTTMAQLGTLARSGHAGAVQAVGEAGEALGVVLAGVVNLLDSSVIVLGGELGDLVDDVRPAVEEALRTRVLSAGWTRAVVDRDVDDVAGASGAALRQLAPVVHDPAAFLST